jgi:hypothetical protein
MAVFERQKIMTKRRSEFLADYVPECKTAIDNFMRIEKVVNSKESFKLAEKAYGVIVDSCKRNNP